LIGEEPLLIRIEEKPYSVLMRTPGEEVFHAAGFCLGEGIVDSPADFMMIGYCKDRDPNVVDIRLRSERRESIHDILERRGFVSQTSCGICGKEMIEEIYQKVTPVQSDLEISVDRIVDCVNKLAKEQIHYQTTRGSHASLLLDDELDTVSFAEDVGRHNALDKAIGNAFMNRKLPRAGILVLSSRISYELVQKAARAQVPVMVSASRPTALAVEMGKALDMTIAFSAGDRELTVVSSKSRIKTE